MFAPWIGGMRWPDGEAVISLFRSLASGVYLLLSACGSTQFAVHISADVLSFCSEYFVVGDKAN